MKNVFILLLVVLLPLAMQAEKPNHMQFGFTSYMSPHWQDSYVHLHEQMRDVADFVMQFNQIDGDEFSPINRLSVRFNGEDCVVLKNDLINALAHVQSLIAERSNLCDDEVDHVNQLIDELIDVVAQDDQSGRGQRSQQENSSLCGKDSFKVKKILCALNKALFCDDVVFNGPVIFNECVDIKGRLKVEHTAKIHSLKVKKAEMDKIEARKAEIKKIETKKIDVCDLNVTCTANATCDLIVGCNIYMHDSESSLVGNIYKDGLPFLHNFGLNNTFVGSEAGNFTMNGNQNSVLGWQAFRNNVNGVQNTALGSQALIVNTSGSFNIAIGTSALISNTTGFQNVAVGVNALNRNIVGINNVAVGNRVLFANTGSNNTALGASALTSNTLGNQNVAVGLNALDSNTTGSNNIALGTNAGSALVTGNDNIDIANIGVAGDNGTIRIGTIGTHTTNFQAGIRSVATGIANAVPVVIDSNGQLGTMNSSIRFKHNIHDMNEVSSPIYNLRPVTFTLISDLTNVRRFGLIAEEVAEVLEDLVIRDGEGRIETVRYMDIITLLLNELIKLNARVIALEEAVYY